MKPPVSESYLHPLAHYHSRCLWGTSEGGSDKERKREKERDAGGRERRLTEREI